MAADQKLTLQALLSQNIEFTGSLTSKFGQGNKTLKSQIGEIVNASGFDYGSLGGEGGKVHSLESAMSIFKPKEYLNRHLLNLEKTLDL